MRAATTLAFADCWTAVRCRRCRPSARRRGRRGACSDCVGVELVTAFSVALTMRAATVLDRLASAKTDWMNVIDLEAQRMILRQLVIDRLTTDSAVVAACAQSAPDDAVNVLILPASVAVVFDWFHVLQSFWLSMVFGRPAGAHQDRPERPGTCRVCRRVRVPRPSPCHLPRESPLNKDSAGARRRLRLGVPGPRRPGR
jgi:hypothetical protein